ncbi:hypothetical protein TURU_103384 [Turdus rufiventris]|nr:hypothetical protein TURU_103384 [Turdus rufiventris]
MVISTGADIQVSHAGAGSLQGPADLWRQEPTDPWTEKPWCTAYIISTIMSLILRVMTFLHIGAQQDPHAREPHGEVTLKKDGKSDWSCLTKRQSPGEGWRGLAWAEWMTVGQSAGLIPVKGHGDDQGMGTSLLWGEAHTAGTAQTAEEMAQRDLSSEYKHSIRTSKEDGAVVPRDRSRSKGDALKYWKFHLHLNPLIFPCNKVG